MKILALIIIPAAVCACVLLLEDHPRNSPREFAQPVVAVHGELISPAVVSNQLAQNFVQTNAKPRRFTPPPSTQKRMVMFQMKMEQLVDEQPVGGVSNAAPVPLTTVTGAPELVPAGYQSVGFEKLSSFNFVLTDEVVNSSARACAWTNQIPDEIQKLDGIRAGVRGFLLPVKMEDGLAVEFLLMRDRSFCCYGAPPKINQWLTVHINGRGVKPQMDEPITVLGKLHVGEKRENGYLVGIYEMEADRVIGLP